MSLRRRAQPPAEPEIPLVLVTHHGIEGVDCFISDGQRQTAHGKVEQGRHKAVREVSATVSIVACRIASSSSPCVSRPTIIESLCLAAPEVLLFNRIDHAFGSSEKAAQSEACRGQVDKEERAYRNEGVGVGGPPTRPLVAIGALLFIYLASTSLALRSLLTAAKGVIDAVKEKDLGAARQRLSMIVGRDTQELEEEAILRATIETVAENLSDGFVAPLLYLAVGGLPLAIAYKAVNTLDSMVGYKNERYLRFGWAAARLDDAANYVPARITGFILAPAAFCRFLTDGPAAAFRAARGALAAMRRDGRKHTSPNSGIPEAAMAGALGVRLGGPSTYGGMLVKKPFIGDGTTGDYRISADRALSLSACAATLATALALACLLVLGKII